jgi:hypothetical protein
MNSLTLDGDGKAEGSSGVGVARDGVDAVVVGVDREDSLFGKAIGKVRESRFVMRDEEDVGRQCRFVDRGGAVVSSGKGIMLPSRLLCLSLLRARAGPGVATVGIVVVRGVDDDGGGSGVGAKVEVVAAQMVLLMTEGSIGTRSAADERRRISECEAIPR